MPQPIRRRFTLLDAMILVAASAVGAGYWRVFYPTILGESEGHYDLEAFYKSIALFAWPFSPALMIAQFVGPSRGRRRLSREPGFLANFAVVFAWAMTAWNTAIFLFIHGALVGERTTVQGLLPYSLWYNTWTFVLMAWCGLAISGAWKSGANWIDRAGRFLGAFWLAIYFVDVAYRYWLHHR